MTTVTRVSVEDFLTPDVPRGAWLVDGEVVVNELWLVDPFDRSVLVFRRSAPGVATFDVLDERQAHEQLTSPLLPGFALEVGGLFPTG